MQDKISIAAILIIMNKEQSITRLKLSDASFLSKVGLENKYTQVSVLFPCDPHG